jgi:hypothetical protein
VDVFFATSVSKRGDYSIAAANVRTPC